LGTKKPAQPVQDGLFGTLVGAGGLMCPDISGMPLIVDPRGELEVMAPGSVYQPLLLEPRQASVVIGPGWLDGHEEAFVRDLIKWLYPAGDHPKSVNTPLQWGGKEIWLKRNLEKRDESFRLRVDDSDWYYPDFIVWIIDHATRTQTFGFVDPKGLTLGAPGGWSDYKVICTLYAPHLVERQLAAAGQSVIYEGHPWTFRVRGLLLSNSTHAALAAQAKFDVRNTDGQKQPPKEADFGRGRIVFQSQNSHDRAYIAKVLQRLTEDSEIDHLLQQTALLFDPQHYFTPSGEAGHDLALRFDEGHPNESKFVQALLEDYLVPDAAGQHGTWCRNNRRGQLMDYAKKGGLLGFGAEKVADLLNNPAPCETLWQRRHPVAMLKPVVKTGCQKQYP
jgi:hypothetical protein